MCNYIRFNNTSEDLKNVMCYCWILEVERIFLKDRHLKCDVRTIREVLHHLHFYRALSVSTPPGWKLVESSQTISKVTTLP